MKYSIQTSVKGDIHMDYEAINIMLDIHNKWLQGEEGGEQMELENADLSNMVLRGSNFSQAVIKNVDFKGADLRKCNFLGAYIYDSDFTFADIRGANFEQSEMRGNKLNGVDVGANVISSKLSVIDMINSEEQEYNDKKEIELTDDDFTAFDGAYEDVVNNKEH